MVGNLKRKTSTMLAVAIISAGLFTPLVNVHATVTENGNNTNAVCLTDSDTADTTKNGDSSASSSSTTSSGGMVHTRKGDISQAKVDQIKQIAKHMNEEYGFGQDQLAAIMSVALRECTWDITAYNASGQVAGLFQWGCGSTNGDRIHPAGVDPSKLDVDATIKILDYEIKGGVNAQTTGMISGMASAGNDGSKAFVAWAKYEGVSVTDGQSKTDEVVSDIPNIAKILGTDDMKIDQSKIDKLNQGHASSGANTTTQDSGTTTDVANTSGCDSASSESAEADGTGSITSKSGAGWKHDQVPSDVQPYITHPEKSNLTFHDSKNFLSGISDGTQCTDFAESYFNQIWKLNMTSGVHGNGKDVAKAMADKFGGSTTAVPKAGAICSVPSTASGVGDAGHVLVVCHVLADKSIIIVEQNFGGMSGELNNGEHYSWNYRYIPESTYKTENYVFYTPEGKTADLK